MKLPVHDGHVRFVMLDSLERRGFGVVIRLHLDGRSATQLRESRFSLRDQKTLDRYLTDESALIVHEVHMTELFP